MTLIALQGGTLVGFVTLIPLTERAGVRDSLWVITLYVKTPYRRQGIGATLMNRCADKTRRAGYPALYLWTESPDLTSYYAQRGWRWIGRDEEGDDIMTYDLEVAGDVFPQCRGAPRRT